MLVSPCEKPWHTGRSAGYTHRYSMLSWKPSGLQDFWAMDAPLLIYSHKGPWEELLQYDAPGLHKLVLMSLVEKNSNEHQTWYLAATSTHSCLDITHWKKNIAALVALVKFKMYKMHQLNLGKPPTTTRNAKNGTRFWPFCDAFNASDFRNESRLLKPENHYSGMSQKTGKPLLS